MFYTDDSVSFYRNVCEMIANILAIIFLLKLSSKTHLNAPKLSINYTKPEFLLITKKRNNVDFNITMSNRKIERKSHVKYLGVIIDDALLWEPHIKQVCSKIPRGSFAILKL